MNYRPFRPCESHRVALSCRCVGESTSETFVRENKNTPDRFQLGAFYVVRANAPNKRSSRCLENRGKVRAQVTLVKEKKTMAHDDDKRRGMSRREFI